MIEHMGRRAFLRGAGGALLALPHLPRWSRSAQANPNPGEPPLRFIIVQHGQGTLLDQWTPSEEGTGYTLPHLLRPLERHRERMLVASGISNRARRSQRQGNGHIPANRSLFTATPFVSSYDDAGRATVPREQQVSLDVPYGPSIDQEIARLLETPGRRRSIHLDITRSNRNNQMWWRGSPGQVEAVQAEYDPIRAYESLFGNVSFPEDMPRELTRRERFRARFPRLLDRVASAYVGLEAQVPSEDREVLQRHAEQVRRLEQTLQTQVDTQRSACARPQLNLPQGYDPRDDRWEDVSADAHIELLAMAMACDVSRVATLSFGNSHAPDFSFIDGLTIPAPGYSNWHDMVHKQNDDASRERLAYGFQWYSEKVAQLVDRLDAIPEGDGTMLDHTLILWTSEFGNGGRHWTDDLPVVLLGSLGGRVRTGRHLRFEGATTNDLYVALLQLFGGNQSTFGLEEGWDGERLMNGPLEVAS